MRRLILIPAIATILALGGAPIAALAATATPEATNPAPQPSGSLVVSIVDGVTNAVATITDISVVDGVLTATGTITGMVLTTTGDILTLDIGAIHLDLLGLVVDTTPIGVDITAVAGAGNLLGNLLCAVAHLLDGNASLNAIAALLDRILSILG